MKLTTLLILLAVVISPVGSSGTPQTWATKKHYVLMDGNELYTICQIAEKTVTVSGEKFEVSPHSPNDAFASGQCLGYIMAVVDSIPEGEGFGPSSNVRLTQYMDVVRLYLHDSPDKREKPAYYLVRVAITNAFPTRP